MKKIITVSLILLMIIFAGCGQSGNVGELTPEDIARIKELEIDNNMCVDTKMLFFETYDEYAKYIKERTAEGGVPDRFCIYEKLKSLGEFEAITFLEGTPNEFDRYLYQFITDNGKLSKVYVYHTSKEYDKIDIKCYAEGELPENKNDVRVFNSAVYEDGVTKYMYNNIEYRYYNGKLDNVTFFAGESYVLVSVEDYDKYPLNSDTFQSKILNLETAEKAITDLFGEIRPLEEFYATASDVQMTENVDGIFY